MDFGHAFRHEEKSASRTRLSILAKDTTKKRIKPYGISIILAEKDLTKPRCEKVDLQLGTLHSLFSPNHLSEKGRLLVGASQGFPYLCRQR